MPNKYRNPILPVSDRKTRGIKKDYREYDDEDPESAFQRAIEESKATSSSNKPPPKYSNGRRRDFVPTPSSISQKNNQVSDRRYPARNRKPTKYADGYFQQSSQFPSDGDDESEDEYPENNPQVNFLVTEEETQQKELEEDEKSKVPISKADNRFAEANGSAQQRSTRYGLRQRRNVVSDTHESDTSTADELDKFRDTPTHSSRSRSSAKRTIDVISYSENENAKGSHINHSGRNLRKRIKKVDYTCKTVSVGEKPTPVEKSTRRQYDLRDRSNTRYIFDPFPQADILASRKNKDPKDVSNSY
jgi:hypothetical protein